MKRKFELTTQTADQMIYILENFQKSLQKKADEVCLKLASIGATAASVGFSSAIYTGENDTEVIVEPVRGGYRVKAFGRAVLFIEFGSGIRYGNGHPEAQEFGMGAGTYPGGKGHWDSPNGWWIPREHGGGHTYGNPPAAAMYEAKKRTEEMIRSVVSEVFGK